MFRSFDQDLNLVTYEFDKFCNGEHPCYNGTNGAPLVKFDGSKQNKDYRFKDPNQ